MDMIKLQDFARENGVTDRNIQKHVKKYAAELDGHVIKKGPGGTWLDEYAQKFIKDHMMFNPIVVYDQPKEELEKLKNDKIELLEEMNKLKDKMLEKDEKLLEAEKKLSKQQLLLEDAEHLKKDFEDVSKREKDKDLEIERLNRQIEIMNNAKWYQRLFKKY